MDRRQELQQRVRRAVTSIEELLNSPGYVVNPLENRAYLLNSGLTKRLQEAEIIDSHNNAGVMAYQTQDEEINIDGYVAREKSNDYTEVDIVIAQKELFRYSQSTLGNWAREKADLLLRKIGISAGMEKMFLPEHGARERAYIRFQNRGDRFQLVSGSYWVPQNNGPVLAEEFTPDDTDVIKFSSLATRESIYDELPIVEDPLEEETWNQNEVGYSSFFPRYDPNQEGINI